MNVIPAYQTDQDGIYLYEVKAHRYALDPNQYNVPYRAVLKKPPTIKDGKRARWISAAAAIHPAYQDGKWKIENLPAPEA